MTDTNPSTTPATQDDDLSLTSPRFVTHRIYTKGASFEATAMTLNTLKDLRPPVVEFQAQANFAERGEDCNEATLAVNLTGKLDGNLLWRIQLQQGGLFTLEGFEEEQRKHVLNGFCMNMLFPYVCENVAGLVTKGGFPPVYLTPMNFEALYQEQLKQQAPPAASENISESVH